MRTHLLPPGVPSVLRLLALLALLVPSACNGAAGSPPDAVDHGDLSVTFADAAADEVESFVVEVTGVALRKLDGTVVGVLATPVEVDFAALDGASQLLRLLDIPTGTYTAATITLDFSNARCVLVGQSAQATILTDQDLVLSGTLQVAVNLGTPLQVAHASHELLEIDLDLNQSLLVDSAGNSVAFTPVFVLRTDAAQTRPVRITGTLVSSDSAGSSFVLTVHAENGTSLGDVRCTTGGSTTFQIDGAPSLGAAGSSALAALAPGTWVEGEGVIDSAAAGMTLTNVVAGIGTWDGGTDILEGYVIDRAGSANPTLTVLGQSSDATHANLQFETTFTVLTTLPNTHVLRKASTAVFDMDDVNVGQRVRIFGALAGVTLNATVGVVRLEPTQVLGIAAGAPAAGALTLDLSNVGPRGQALFQWADGGTTPADPHAFVTDVGTLANGLGIVAGTHVQLTGFFSAVDDAGADFVAVSAANPETAPALLLVRDELGTGFSVALTSGATEIDITIAGVAAPGEVAQIDQGLLGVTPLPSLPVPKILPAGASGVYTLNDATAGTVTTYELFSTFALALNDVLGLGAVVRHISAVGSYDAIGNTLTATQATVLVE